MTVLVLAYFACLLWTFDANMPSPTLSPRLCSLVGSLVGSQVARESSRRPEVSPGALGLTAVQASVASLHIVLAVVASKSHLVILLSN